MTQEQLGIASGLLVVLLTAFWPVFTNLDSNKATQRGLLEAETPGNPSDFEGDRATSSRSETQPSIETTTPSDASDTGSSNSSTGPATLPAGDPLTTGFPDLSRRS